MYVFLSFYSIRQIKYRVIVDKIKVRPVLSESQVIAISFPVITEINMV